MPTCAVNSRMTEVTANAPRRLQTLYSRDEKDTEAGSFGEVLPRMRLAVNHPEQAKRNRNTKSNAKSVPVGVKSKDILRVRSPVAISALSVAESYHTLEIHLLDRKCGKRRVRSSEPCLLASFPMAGMKPERIVSRVAQERPMSVVIYSPTFRALYLKRSFP